MPRSLWDEVPRRDVLARLANLTPTSRARWGRFSAGAMLAHLDDYLRLALGDVTAPPIAGPLRSAPARWLAVHVLPMVRGIGTLPVLLATPPAAFEADRAELVRLLARAAERGDGGGWPESPLFGPLTGREWGVLAYKHTDHHLRQFGV